MTEKVQMVCGTCGSADVQADAYASWNPDTQKWELVTTFDKGAVCEPCEGETRIEEMPLDKWEAQRTESVTIFSPWLGEKVEISPIFYDDEEKWKAAVNCGDIPVFSTRLLYDDAEEAKDAARRFALHEQED